MIYGHRYLCPQNNLDITRKGWESLMRQKKKIVASLLLLCLLFGTACGNSAGNGTNDIKNEVAISAAVSALEENGMKKIGEPVQYMEWNGTEMEYTVQDVKIFDHYLDAGIPESEFVFGINEEPFILLDIKIKKISGSEWSSEDDYDNISTLQLYNKSMLEAVANGDYPGISEICYFSGHGDMAEDDKEYNYYWLDPGEEAVFQVGWCVHEPLIGREQIAYLNNTEGLTLHIGSVNNTDGGKYIDLTTP